VCETAHVVRASRSRPALQALLRGEAAPPRPLGMRMMLHHRHAAPGRWSGEIVFDRSAANSQGIVFGGSLAAILDVAMGYASLTLLADDELQRTVEMKVSFLRPAPPDRVLADGEVLRRGRRLAYCEGTIRVPDGTVVAKASGTFSVGRPRGTGAP